ncbi:carboxypeptidase regulatory-like domain-containing protein [Cytophagaceae bacterium ABcell3]|nr:carboxypeptidase regulatory-like domain-containing protein [Cytophagaceae bacterium ABcell3]
MLRHALHLFCALFLFPALLTAQNEFTFEVTGEPSDAWVKLHWEIGTSHLRANDDQPVYVKIFDDETGETLHGYTVGDFSWGFAPPEEAETGSFTHFAGPDAMHTYRLQLLAVGDGQLIEEALVTGNTDPFRAPENLQVSQQAYAHRVTLTWETDTDLASEFRVYRDDVRLTREVEETDPGVFSWVDSDRSDNPEHLENGATYTYCVVAYNRNSQQEYAPVCGDGSTYPLNFQAAEVVYDDRVELTWNDLAGQAATLRLFRDGTQLASLPADAQGHTDENPIPGRDHTYRLELLNAQQERLVSASETGGTPPDGRVTGRVYTARGGIGIAGATVTAELEVDEETVTRTVTTGADGMYELAGIYYGEAAEVTLTIAKTGYAFQQEAHEVLLKMDSPHKSGIDFPANTGYDLEGEADLTLEDFVANPAAAPDQVAFSWAYTSDAQPVFFKLYRNDALQTVLQDTDTWVDQTGVPGQSYTYRLVAYRVDAGEEVTLRESTLELSYPEVTSVSELEATPTDDGAIALHWEHVSYHHAGFLIYRDGDQIADLAPETLTFTDTLGLPGSTYTYTVAPYLLRGLTYIAEPVAADPETYPEPEGPTDIAVTPLPEANAMHITWDSPLSPDYYYDGYRIERDGELIATVARHVTEHELEDRTGRPDASHTYSVSAWKAVGEAVYTTAPVTATATHPAVLVPVMTGASDAEHANRITLTWEPHPTGRHDGYALLREGDTVAVLPAGRQQHTDVLNLPPGAGPTFDYVLHSFVNRDGERHYSAAATVTGTRATDTGTLPQPQAFTASTGYPGQVNLAWEYPAYLVYEFELYRDGDLLTTLAPDRRSWVDETAAPGETHLYELQATHASENSPLVVAQGGLRSLKGLSGTVTGRDGTGIAGAYVTVTAAEPDGAGFREEVTTDSAGTYRITELPAKEGLELTVTVEATNHTFDPDTRTITITAEETRYTAGFTSIHPAGSGVPAAPKLTAQPDPLTLEVTLAWSAPQGANTGFEVYRGLTHLGDVAPGQPHHWTDREGEPGMTYLYQVVPYTKADGERHYGEVAEATAVFPKLQPVSSLEATPRTGEDYVDIRWSHPKNHATGFYIYRDGKRIGEVAASSSLAFADTDGAPGQSYNYSVRGFLLGEDGRFFESGAKTARAVFPDVAPVLTFEAAQAPNGVALAWVHPSADADAFRLYRDGQLLTTLSGETDAYTDYSGVPGTAYTYTISARRTVDGQSFLSRANQAQAIFPELEPVTGLTVTPIEAEDHVTLNWVYPHLGHDGFILFREGSEGEPEELVRLYEPEAQNWLVTDGEPEAEYTYRVIPFAFREGDEYRAEEAVYLYTHPELAAPYDLAASQGAHVSHVALTWAHDSERNHGFVIYRDGDVLDTVDAGRRQYRDIIAEPNLIQYTYQVQAFFTTEGGGIRTSTPGEEVTGYVRAFTGEIKLAEALGARVVAMDGNRMVAVSGYESEFMYFVYQEGSDEFVLQNKYGSSTDIGGGRTIAVTLQQDKLIKNTSDGGMNSWLFELNEGVWEFTLSLGSVNRSVGPNNYMSNIDGDRILSEVSGGDPGARVLVHENGSWGEEARFGEDIEIITSLGLSGRYAFLGASSIEDNRQGTVYVYRREGTTWEQVQVLEGSQSQAGDHFGNYLNVHGDNLVVGAFWENRAYAYRYREGNWEEVQRLEPEMAGADRFARQLVVHGNWLAIGERHTSPTTAQIHLYRWDGERWERKQTIDALSDGREIEVVSDFDLSATHLVASLIGGGQTQVITMRLMESRINNITATSGDFHDQVRLTWEAPELPGDVTGFRIYRDDQQVGEVRREERAYFDYNALPGHVHRYQVVAVYASGDEAVPVAVKGHRRANGVLEGHVIAAQGGQGVPGMQITARAVIDGDVYRYTAETDASGEFRIPGVYYGEETRYTVTASFPGHQFVEPEKEVRLSLDQPTRLVPVFVNNTAYVIAGTVARKGATCGMEGIEVSLATYRSGQDGPLTEQTTTDEEGNYAFTVNPLDPNLERIEVWAENTQAYGEPEAMDSLKHDFKAGGFEGHLAVYTDFENFPQVTELNFTDELTYTVTLVVRNVCAPIDEEFAIRITSETGCYDKQFYTSPTFPGRLVEDLPPVDMQIVVEGVRNATPQSLAMVDYLRVRPITLALGQVHLEYGLSDPEAVAAYTERSLVYHNQPEISLDGAGVDYLCDDPAQALLVEQGEAYEYEFVVTETHNGQSCPVDEGYLEIVNHASSDPSELQLNYEDEAEAFPAYLFTGGTPNLSAPHLQSLTVRYMSNEDRLLGEETFQVFVDGTAPVPGSDVIVDASDDGVFQLPLYILRDPMGDRSFSELKEGVTVTNRLKMQSEHMFAHGAELSTKFTAAGVGMTAKVGMKAGYKSRRSSIYEVSLTTDQAIRTSSDPKHVGRPADVIVGAGIAMQYGLMQDVTLDENCQPVMQTTIGFSPNEITTTWLYTVEQIEELIDQYDHQIEQVMEGTLQLRDANNQTIEQGAAVAKLHSLRHNWMQVLWYHDWGALPHWLMCAKDREELFPHYHRFTRRYSLNPWRFLKDHLRAQETLLDEFDALRAEICSQLTGESGMSIPRPDFSGGYEPVEERPVWTSEDVERYNRLYAVYNRLNAMEELLGQITGGQNFMLDQTFKNQLVSQLENMSVEEAPGARNFTFGGGTSLSRSTTSRTSFNRSLSQSAFLNTSASYGILLDHEAHAGFGFILKAAGLEVKPLATLEFNFGGEATLEAGSSETTTTSYTLSDQDVGDQFSVTVIDGPARNHTPFFQLVGGRSSCPYEPGTIARDVPDLNPVTTDGEVVSLQQSRVPPDEAAIFPLQLTNLNPFNETRTYELFLDPMSNPHGAIVRMGGQQLGVSDPLTIPAGQPFYTNISVEKGPVSFQYEDLRIGMRSTCGSETADVLLNVYFDHQCTPVSIVAPGDNWLISRAAPGSEDESLIVTLSDYSVQNPNLEEISLNYRRIGSNQWERIGSYGRDYLADYFEDYRHVYQHPTYPVSWNIYGKDLPDGNYELRATAHCGAEGEVHSNVVRGRVDRSQLRLHGRPQPADGILGLGDELSISFNDNLDCAVFDPDSFTLVTLADEPVPIESVSCFGNRITASLNSGDLQDYNGVMARATLVGVANTGGNALEEPVTWDFRIVNNPVYLHPETVDLTLYQGRTETVIVELHNTSDAGQTYGLSVENDSWLQVDQTAGSVPPAGRQVTLYVDASDLELGGHSNEITVTVDGFSDVTLQVDLTVIPEAADWEVDPGDYTEQLNVIAAYELDGVPGSDEMDKIAVFIGNELRGVANLQSTGADAVSHAAYITVGGGPEDAGEPLRFRVWEAATGVEYDAHPEEVYAFETDKVHGTTPRPLRLTIDPEQDRARYIPLRAGWTWISLNTRMDSMSVAAVLQDLTPTNQDMIKTDNETFSRYEHGAGGWVSLDLDELTPGTGYRIYSRNGDTLRVTGQVIEPENVPLQEGWNLIGMPLDEPVTLAALVHTFKDGDIIRSQDAFATYTENNGWTGTLRLLKPYAAYQMQVAEGGWMSWNPAAGTVSSDMTMSMDTPEEDIATDPAQVAARLADSETDDGQPQDWEVYAPDYSENMILTAYVKLDERVSDHDYNQVGAFIQDELRGTGQLTYLPELNRHLAVFFIYGNAGDQGAPVRFTIYDDERQELRPAHQVLEFQVHTAPGTFMNPFRLSAGEITGLEEAISETLECYPNPTTDRTYLKFHSKTGFASQLTVHDQVGKVLLEQEYQVQSGENRLVVDVNHLPTGMYFVSFRWQGKQQTFKLIKL